MKERVAVVTGASRGIGRAISLSLAERGAKVVACARSMDALKSLAEESRQREFSGMIVPAALDVSDRAAIDPFVDATSEAHGRIDVLVNNAGITRDSLSMNMDDEQFEEVLTTNLRAVFWLCRAVSRVMIRQRYGRIINISSVSGVMGNAGQANYASAKAGIIGLTKTLAKELGKRKVTCNVVAPGFIDTDMTAKLPEKITDTVKQIIPLGRFGQVEEVAEAVSFLAGEGASYITGHVLLVDGGMCM